MPSPTPTPAPETAVVISQIYGSGGNAGATYTNDFIELFNRGTSAVELSGWSVQYASATGTTWQVSNLSGSLPPGGYYLVRQAAGTGCSGGPCGSSLPAPDATGATNMAAAAGKVALVSNAAALSGGCPMSDSSVIDFVGYGSAANCSEGVKTTATQSGTRSLLRKEAGCQDTNDNASDFQSNDFGAGGSTKPRNSGSPTSVCAAQTARTVRVEMNYFNLDFFAAFRFFFVGLAGPCA